jgi:hypothetical protein
MKHETMIMFVSICIIKDKADFAILFSQNRLLLQGIRPCRVLSLRTFRGAGATGAAGAAAPPCPLLMGATLPFAHRD